MPAGITIETIAFDWPGTDNQVVTIAHKIASQPDSAFVVDTTTQQVQPNGQLDPAYNIGGLLYDTWYTVRVSNSCGDGAVAYATLKTDINPCPDVTRVYGTVY